MHDLCSFSSKIIFDQHFSFCWDKLDYPGSIVYLSCYYLILSIITWLVLSPCSSFSNHPLIFSVKSNFSIVIFPIFKSANHKLRWRREVFGRKNLPKRMGKCSSFAVRRFLLTLWNFSIMVSQHSIVLHYP